MTFEVEQTQRGLSAINVVKS
ncbi:MAG: hypothetical protein IPG92_11330 [Flavobacteriales bacterium]|nr:hypothetical protein [Flavobacteriales bacterium]